MSSRGGDRFVTTVTTRTRCPMLLLEIKDKEAETKKYIDKGLLLNSILLIIKDSGCSAEKQIHTI